MSTGARRRWIPWSWSWAPPDRHLKRIHTLTTKPFLLPQLFNILWVYFDINFVFFIILCFIFTLCIHGHSEDFITFTVLCRGLWLREGQGLFPHCMRTAEAQRHWSYPGRMHRAGGGLYPNPCSTFWFQSVFFCCLSVPLCAPPAPSLYMQECMPPTLKGQR